MVVDPVGRRLPCRARNSAARPRCRGRRSSRGCFRCPGRGACGTPAPPSRSPARSTIRPSRIGTFTSARAARARGASERLFSEPGSSPRAREPPPRERECSWSEFPFQLFQPFRAFRFGFLCRGLAHGAACRRGPRGSARRAPSSRSGGSRRGRARCRRGSTRGRARGRASAGRRRSAASPPWHGRRAVRVGQEEPRQPRARARCATSPQVHAACPSRSGTRPAARRRRSGGSARSASTSR